MTRRLRSHQQFSGEVESAAAYFDAEARLGHEFIAAVEAVMSHAEDRTHDRSVTAEMSDEAEAWVGEKFAPADRARNR